MKKCIDRGEFFLVIKNNERTSRDDRGLDNLISVLQRRVGSSVDGWLIHTLGTEGKSSIEGESRRSMGLCTLSKGPRPKLEHLGILPPAHLPSVHL